MRARFEIEACGVPGTGDFVLVDEAFGQRRAAMGAGIVNGVVRSLAMEEGQGFAADGDLLALPVGKLAHLGDGRECHENMSPASSALRSLHAPCSPFLSLERGR